MSFKLFNWLKSSVLMLWQKGKENLPLILFLYFYFIVIHLIHALFIRNAQFGVATVLAIKISGNRKKLLSNQSLWKQVFFATVSKQHILFYLNPYVYVSLSKCTSCKQQCTNDLCGFSIISRGECNNWTFYLEKLVIWHYIFILLELLLLSSSSLPSWQVNISDRC